MRKSGFDPGTIDIFNKQINIAVLFVLIIFAVLILRLGFMQIVHGSFYRTKSENNRIRLQDVPAFRGRILDRKGEVLASSRPDYELYVIPEEVKDQAGLLKKLNQLIGLEPELVKKRLARTSIRYPFRPICIKSGMSRDELAVIETHRFNLSGVMIKVKPQRDYIWGNLACHLLGYMGEISEIQLRNGKYPDNKSGDLIGKSGVEKRWQIPLNGIRGGEQVEVDASGRKIKVISRKPPFAGADVYLTIDKDLQALAEETLAGRAGAIVAMNPDNGELLALASSISFDPNLFVEEIDKQTWKDITSSGDFSLHNRALCGQYPPGSVFKIVVALAGLQEGLIDPDEEIVCNGAYHLGGHKFRCWKKHGHGAISLHRALVESCDVYFYNMGKRLGVDKIAHYAKMLGLGRKTGLDVGQEKAGLIPTSDWKLRRYGVPWQGGETISTSIGQSFVLVTPIQVACMISAVFNGGILYRPQATRLAGKSKTGKVYEFNPEITGRINIRQEYLDIVKNALVGAVNERRGTGSKAKLEDIIVAGKTGTAQVVALEKEKSFSNSGHVPVRFRDHAWFVAIAPPENPRIALAIVIEHGGHGGSAAAPVAKELIKFYLDQPADNVSGG